ncbi:MAG: dihydroneopterin aldolase [Pedobacter sp.]|nr:MAG: dihydroneopterin aldolase [Pedobacter sp.]
MISIQLVNVQMYAFHGVFEGEEKIGNPYIINLSVKYEERDKEFANIDDTINYEKLYKILRHWMEVPTGLLEKICVNIIRHIKHDYPFVKEIDLSIQKLQPPLEQFQGNVGVTMNRKFND